MPFLSYDVDTACLKGQAACLADPGSWNPGWTGPAILDSTRRHEAPGLVLHCESPVDVQHLSRDETSRWRCQVNDTGGDLDRFAHPAQRSCRQDKFHCFVGN